MGRRLIEVMQVLVDQVHKGGYQHRVLEDSIYEESQRRIAVEKDRDAARSEIDTLRKKLADAKHEDYENEIRAAAALICPEASGETTIPGMAGEILRLRKDRDAAQTEIETLRQQLADAQRAVSDAFAEVNSVRQQLDAAEAAATLKQTRIERQRRVVDKVRQMLFKPNRDIEYGDINGLRAALADFEAGTEPAIDGDALAEGVTKVCQEITDGRKAKEIERLRAFVNLSRRLLGANIAYADVGRLRAGLAELDAGTEPTPVAERCPECDGSGMVDSGGFGPDGKGINVPCGGDCRGNPCPSQPTPVAEPLDAEENTCPGK